MGLRRQKSGPLELQKRTASPTPAPPDQAFPQACVSGDLAVERARQVTEVDLDNFLTVMETARS